MASKSKKSVCCIVRKSVPSRWTDMSKSTAP